MSKSIGIIYRIRHKLSAHSLLMLYRSLIQPYCDYCNIVWGTGHSSSLETLFRKQKRAIRVINYAKWNSHTSPLFRRFKVLSIFDTNKFQTSCFVYKSMNGLLPISLNNLFHTNYDVHEHDTRQASKIHVVHHRLKVREYSITIYGTKIWNSLDKYITDSPSFNMYSRSAAKHTF